MKRWWNAVKAGAISLAAVGWCSESAHANHGPGTSGGGSGTISGETLKQGAFDFSFRFDLTEFDHFDQSQAEQQAIKSDEFDALKRGMILSTSLGYGITEDLQVGATIGAYNGTNFIDAEATGPDSAESATANPSGLTDLWTNVKYRVMRNRWGNLALVGGVKFPTGKDDVRLTNGELLEPSSQPGTGAFDFQGGLGYSRFITANITMDASAMYTCRLEHDDFTVGDRFDAGLALAYRLTDDIKAFPNYSVFCEALTVWIGKDDDEGTLNPNSGGTTVYLSPGLRMRFDNNVAATIAPAFPVYQDLNGDQDKVTYKASFILSFSF